MDERLARRRIKAKTGEEPFHTNGRPIEPPLSIYDFWQWACSDLVDNTFRGCLAEFIVASALGKLNCLRDAWGSHDVKFDEITIPVKCSAYLQSWFQKSYSTITFDLAPKRASNADTNELEESRKRHSMLYVFCLHRHKDKPTVDPLDLDQWVFYVLPTHTLETAFPNQKTIGLPALLALGAEETTYHELRPTIEKSVALMKIVAKQK